MVAAAKLAEVPVWQCDGFRVESPEGRLGTVEETWLGSAGEPAALAVRLPDGGRGLLLAEDVRTVLLEDRQVVAVPEARLLELDAPRLERTLSDGGARRVSASWATTGALLPTPDPPRFAGLFRLHHAPAPRPPAKIERPIWQTVLILYATIALIAGLLMAVAFLAAGGAG